ncbi:hypothetical protein D3C80_1957900 [compost metagenome]
MLIKSKDLAIYETDTFPDTVSEHKTGVEYRDLCLIALEEFAVDIDHDVVIAGVCHVSL